jgi:hypothetical protein
MFVVNLAASSPSFLHLFTLVRVETVRKASEVNAM